MPYKSEKRILAIGGHVVKTAVDGLKKAIERGKVDMLIHNGGSIFHDFQLASTKDVKIWTSESHSYPLSLLMDTPEINRPTSLILWNWLEGRDRAPEGSATRMCQDYGIPVLLFTGHGCDFWHLFKGSKAWEFLGGKMFYYFEELRDRLEHDFHYVCMGSAVIHPEVFTKALASVELEEGHAFTADVVDFLDMYRPRTRISQYGTYYKMTHEEYFYKWLKSEL